MTDTSILHEWRAALPLQHYPLVRKKQNRYAAAA